jgi:hypothetical protein
MVDQVRFAYNDRVRTPDGWVGIVKAWEAADRRPGVPLLARVNEETPPYRMEWFKESDLQQYDGPES